VSVKTGRDAAGALDAALATTTRALDRSVNQAEINLAGFRLTGISHSHTLSITDDAMIRAVVTGIASYVYT
jgi:hypothetical protein